MSYQLIYIKNRFKELDKINNTNFEFKYNVNII